MKELFNYQDGDKKETERVKTVLQSLGWNFFPPLYQHAERQELKWSNNKKDILVTEVTLLSHYVQIH